MLKLLGLPTCEGTSIIKTELEEKEISYSEINVNTEEGIEIVKAHRLNQSPALLICNDSGTILDVKRTYAQMNAYINTL